MAKKRLKKRVTDDKPFEFVKQALPPLPPQTEIIDMKLDKYLYTSRTSVLSSATFCCAKPDTDPGYFKDAAVVIGLVLQRIVHANSIMFKLWDPNNGCFSLKIFQIRSPISQDKIIAPGSYISAVGITAVPGSREFTFIAGGVNELTHAQYAELRFHSIVSRIRGEMAPKSSSLQLGPYQTVQHGTLKSIGYLVIPTLTKPCHSYSAYMSFVKSSNKTKFKKYHRHEASLSSERSTYRCACKNDDYTKVVNFLDIDIKDLTLPLNFHNSHVPMTVTMLNALPEKDKFQWGEFTFKTVRVIGKVVSKTIDRKEIHYVLEDLQTPARYSVLQYVSEDHRNMVPMTFAPKNYLEMLGETQL